jgi:predicted PurR-regulated permease PerM
MALGIGLFGLGVSSVLQARPLPMPLTIALFIAGALETALCWFAMKGVRAAWAFALSISGTAGLVFLFSAPKIRDALEVSLGVALLPCLAGAAAAIMLAMATGEIKGS